MVELKATEAVELKAAEAVEVKAAEEKVEVAIARSGYSHPRTVRTPIIVYIAWPRPSTSGIGTCQRERRYVQWWVV